MGLIEHLERHLGLIDAGWGKSASGESLGVQIARFRDAPVSGAITMCTLGMSGVPLRLSDRSVRLELLATVWEHQFVPELAAALVSVSRRVTDSETALLRGEVVDLRKQFLPGSAAEALYCTLPVYFPDDFGVCRDDEPPTQLVWMIPIHREEIDFIKLWGWEVFEGLIEERDPDLLDLARPSAVGDDASEESG